MDKDDVLALHDLMLGQHGGRPGVRDDALLDSALHRPRHLFTYKKPLLADLGAAYAFGIVKDHPFFDGNKRTGFLTAATFVEANGLVVVASEEEVVSATVALAAGAMTEAEYAAWLKANCRPP